MAPHCNAGATLLPIESERRYSFSYVSLHPDDNVLFNLSLFHMQFFEIFICLKGTVALQGEHDQSAMRPAVQVIRVSGTRPHVVRGKKWTRARALFFVLSSQAFSQHNQHN
jgi:hypothetical protein